MGRAGLGRAAETSWAVFVLVVFLFSWFSRQTTWEIVGPEPDPPPYETGGVTVEAGVPEPGCLKESCSSVMQKLLPHFTEEETEAQGHTEVSCLAQGHSASEGSWARMPGGREVTCPP